MTSLLKPGDPFVYMKVGVHANESLKDIIQRTKDKGNGFRALIHELVESELFQTK